MPNPFRPKTRTHPPFEGPLFNDHRLESRFFQLQSDIEKSGSSIVNQVSESYSERKSAYRFFRNESSDIEKILGSYKPSCKDLVSGKDILAISDSSEITLKGQYAHLKDAGDVGVLSDNKTPGFHIHATMALDAQSGLGLCLSDLILWNRPKRQSKKAKSVKGFISREKKLAPHERESYKWELGVKHSESVFGKANRVTYLFDREADIFSLFHRIKQLGPDRGFIIRSSHNRKVVSGQDEILLSDYLESLALGGEYLLAVDAQNRRNSSKRKDNNRQARQANMELRYGPITLLDPENSSKDTRTLKLWVVQALESRDSVPQGEDPIHWKLITSRSIDSVKEAMQIIRYYEMRWQIEQLFRLIKNKGFQIEACELQYLSSIMKMTVMVVYAAFNVLQLMLARDNVELQAKNHLFSKEQMLCLEQINRKYQGKTEKLKNPYKDKQLAWASWVIARLGGWKGLKSQGPPGPITMVRGIVKFNTYFDAWKIFK